MKLRSRVAIVTGASSGIGRAIARELAGQGMRLVVTARREEALEELCRELEGATAVVADIVEPLTPQLLVDRSLEHWGRCDVVVNNAGILETGSLQEIDLERVCRMVRVNVEAAYRMSYTALRHFKQVGSGHLLNVSSILATKIRPFAGAYAGTKHAIEALTEALRLEMAGTGVRVSSLQPGLVMTGLHDHLPVHPSQLLGIQYPLKPEDVARAARFILEQPEEAPIARLAIVPGDSAL